MWLFESQSKILNVEENSSTLPHVYTVHTETHKHTMIRHSWNCRTREIKKQIGASKVTLFEPLLVIMVEKCSSKQHIDSIFRQISI